MCMYKDKEDGHCIFRSCAAVTEYCVDGPCVDEVLTNADHIRAMSDEALAEFLSNCWATFPRAWQKEYGETLYWLQQPAEENTDA